MPPHPPHPPPPGQPHGNNWANISIMDAKDGNLMLLTSNSYDEQCSFLHSIVSIIMLGAKHNCQTFEVSRFLLKLI